MDISLPLWARSDKFDDAVRNPPSAGDGASLTSLLVASPDLKWQWCLSDKKKAMRSVGGCMPTLDYDNLWKVV